MPAIGTCFQVIPEGDNHFWIVISKIFDGRVFVVNITKSVKCPDSPCHFAVGEHSTITEPSAVFYRKARTFSATNVDAQLADGQLVRRLEDYPPELVKRIIDGAQTPDCGLTLKFLKYIE
jgi:hypothetical protein